MKKLLLLLLAVFSLQFGYGQEEFSEEELQLMRDLFGAEKREIIDQNVNLEGTNGDAFWKLYDEYEKNRQEIGQEKLALLKQYTLKQGNMTELQADEMLAKAVQIRESEDKLIANYTRRIRKSTNAFVAVQFYQIEHYLSDGIRFSILNNIDFIQD